MPGGLDTILTLQQGGTYTFTSDGNKLAFKAGSSMVTAYKFHDDVQVMGALVVGEACNHYPDVGQSTNKLTRPFALCGSSSNAVYMAFNNTATGFGYNQGGLIGIDGYLFLYWALGSGCWALGSVARSGARPSP